MTSRTVNAGGRAWRFSPDGAPGRAQRVQAMVDLTVTSEPDGALTEPASVRAPSRPGLTPRNGPGGRAGLAGRPVDTLPPAAIAGTDIAVEVSAPGHLTQAITVTLTAPPQPGRSVLLHGEPVAIWGQVVRVAAGVPSPVSGATVRVVGFAPRRTDPVTSLPDEDLLAIGGGLRAAREAQGPKAAVLRRRQLPLAETYALLRGAGAGETVLSLSGRQSLTVPVVPGSPDLLLIEPGEAERLEVLAVTAIAGTASAAAPATVTLAYPLRRVHPEGAPVRRVAAALPGPDVALRRPAATGDVTLLAADASGFAGFAFVEVATPGGIPTAEHHPLLQLAVITDAEGRFRLPALHRARTLSLEVAPPVGAAVTLPVDLGPGGPVRTEELRLS
ncbi:hypothetical protein [Paracraurococcus lichenis]|uniref:DUF4785 family protein n=1 Tax=Paracraurococcus lichenis TaxID=3064888 RepID=A0ABT9E9Q0_9PROT|nr:hypothetical protein [Paracraurococcus sp. LOR1-02]MDO9712908.1 hypothetical protein [Paracraurococcus sp. LOR1-02]